MKTNTVITRNIESDFIDFGDIIKVGTTVAIIARAAQVCDKDNQYYIIDLKNGKCLAKFSATLNGARIHIKYVEGVLRDQYGSCTYVGKTQITIEQPKSYLDTMPYSDAVFEENNDE